MAVSKVRTLTAPPKNLRRGAHEIKPGMVSFALWAPWKKSVHLVGDFNHWDARATPLQVLQDGLWWVVLKLSPGTHAYQFVIDGQTWIADPYATRLHWVEGRDQPHSLFTVGEKPYRWGDEHFQARPLNQLIIYEMHVGNFSPEGTFRGVTERLDYIRDLGVNAIELMPIQEFPGDQSWGYNPAFFFCPETAYGNVEDLKTLVDQAHQRGISVILHMVFNHTDALNPLTRLYAYQDSPYFGSDGNPWGFPDFNHWSDATKVYIRDIQDYWLFEFHIDGFRYDYSEGIGWDAENGLSFITWAARQTKPHVYLIAENIPDPTGVVHNTQADAAWHSSFSYLLRAQLMESDYMGNRYGDMQGVMNVMIFSQEGFSDNAQAINYLESHDEDRIAHSIRSNPPLDIDEAVRAKAKLGAVALFTATGVPMLYAGQEFGMSHPKSIDVHKLDWDRLQDPGWESMRHYYASLAHLHSSTPCLTLNQIEPVLVDEERKIIIFKRWDEGGSQVMVGLNFTPGAQTLEVTFPRGGTWHEWTYNYDEHIQDDGRAHIELPPSGGKVWIAS